MPVEDDIGLLEQYLGYRFTRKELVEEALVHRSWLNERGDGCSASDNERLEFFGDALMDFLVAEYLLHVHPTAREGTLSRLRAELVSEAGLAPIAARLELGRFLRLGRGEELCGGRSKPSLLANALEALLGAIYLDGGLAAARSFVTRFVVPRAEQVQRSGGGVKDFKSALQELVQAKGRVAPKYRVQGESGPPHQRMFEVVVLLDEAVIGTGQGSSKKVAEQAAAAAALAALDAGGRE